jgi:hypothetical protein
MVTTHFKGLDDTVFTCLSTGTASLYLLKDITEFVCKDISMVNIALQQDD